VVSPDEGVDVPWVLHALPDLQEELVWEGEE